MRRLPMPPGKTQPLKQDCSMAGGDEGLRVNPRLSLLGDFSVDPLFEPTTVYVLDSKLDSARRRFPFRNHRCSHFPGHLCRRRGPSPTICISITCQQRQASFK